MGCYKGVKQHHYTQEETEFIRINHVGIGNIQLAEMFNKKFGTDLKPATIQSFKKRHGFNSGLTGCFEKGQISHNKGKKQSEYMSAEAIQKSSVTRFKKGNIPPNHRPVGSTRITRDGYKEIKIAEPNKWKLMSRYVYEQNFGEVPKGFAVVHLNRDTLDDRPENLVLMSRSEVCRLNHDGLMCDDLEINQVAINIARIKAKISERGKK